MKNLLVFILFIFGALSFQSCTQNAPATSSAADNSATQAVGQSGVQDDESQKNIVQIAAGSKDHTTLVAAVKAAGLVDVLTNAGPFTVYAPTNAAFEKLPKGTVEELLKPENKEKLQNILEYHVSVAVYKPENMRDGQKVNQVNLKDITFGKQGDKLTVNGANIIATIPASNGIIHVVDAVLLPPEK
ncbi:MAG TPA: fasciclin domain-containing protein [Saprospiraceae bacterium]|nr:fasciclin domain-containing protein [Saprospiraceae bacterium]HNL38265.1 fasciclin domain-containing protein [Saprospiraceae bacterium]HNM27311.1 fasciclin domain-containing protein [Saprospiraceae bacterium]